MAATYDTVSRILVERFDVSADMVAPGAQVGDLVTNSLDLVEFAVALTEETGIPLTDDEMLNITTVGNLVAVLDAKAAAAS